MSKCLCKFRRTEIIGQINRVRCLVDNPRFLCKSCARVANGASSLCKPVLFQDKKVENREESAVSHEVDLTLTRQQKKSLGKNSRKLKKLFKKQKKLAKKYRKLMKKMDISECSLPYFG
ncbi:hypothetical protein [Vibrio salinus]|uniref:hypothetical protein n=1 Tax=Vibrio salinus TaxID=2899784 RepID=UPI001E608F85|nr:hypothetical protein [Vibrio salinus]MCE0493587.1 hypothetical protein [Vibrio salinus]